MHTSLLNLAAFLSKKVPSQTLTLFLKLRKLLMYDHPGCNARVRVGFGVFFSVLLLSVAMSCTG